MPQFESDYDVDPLEPRASLEDLVRLLSLLCGEELSFSDGEADLGQERARTRILKQAFEASADGLTSEQLNELLLLLGQSRISKHFFDFFFLGRVCDGKDEPASDQIASWEQIKAGVVKFRGFALLCFGNFRFAFKRLSQLQERSRLLEELGSWRTEPDALKEQYEGRPSPIVTIAEEGSEVKRDDTWQLGYISRGEIFKDAAKVHLLEAKGLDESLEERAEKIDVAEVEKALRGYWARLPEQFVADWRELLSELKERLEEYTKAFEAATEKGIENTFKYLTWDYLDVYVATSMRDQWNFTDAYDSIKSIWSNPVGNLEGLKLRWFDPTQSYEASIIDKGLVEGLMLKRAELTIYMAQESETLGKDSELAATLAQGKPVIAYVPEYSNRDDLGGLVEELRRRPVEYFRKRLRTLEANGFFERLDNISLTIERLVTLGKEELSPDEFLSQLYDGREVVDTFAPEFAFVSTEEETFVQEHAERMELLYSLMAAVEAVEADNRANVLKNLHPLAFQVNLETGVANGVLVARSPEACAKVVRGFLLNQLVFRIERLTSPSDEDHRLATVLEEAITGSRFRVVTTNSVLTNSFWNFYPSDQR